MEYTNGIIVCNQDLLLANQEKLSDRKHESYTKGEISKEQYDDWRYNYK
jgi:hypothetical protein